MNITEVRIKLMDEPGDRLKAFCSITFDNCFVVRDLKIIEGSTGPFVAMPSRKLTAHCGKCGMKNHLRANHCNQCGAKLDDSRVIKDQDGRTKLYADIAHPINSRCREMIQNHVVAEYNAELERAKDPNYTSRYDDYDGGDFHESDAYYQRRYDEAHGHHGSNQPHQPPQGDPMHSAQSTGPKESPIQGNYRGKGPASNSHDAAEADEPQESSASNKSHGPQNLSGNHFSGAKRRSASNGEATASTDKSDSQTNDDFGAGIL